MIANKIAITSSGNISMKKVAIRILSIACLAATGIAFAADDSRIATTSFGSPEAGKLQICPDLISEQGPLPDCSFYDVDI